MYITPTRHDRRRKLRGHISIPVSLAVGDGEVPWLAETLDLSEGGALVRTEARLAPGTRARLRIAFDGTEYAGRLYEAEGTIGRSDDYGRVAVLFSRVTEDLRAFAQTLVGRA